MVRRAAAAAGGDGADPAEERDHDHRDLPEPDDAEQRVPVLADGDEADDGVHDPHQRHDPADDGEDGAPRRHRAGEELLRADAAAAVAHVVAEAGRVGVHRAHGVREGAEEAGVARHIVRLGRPEDPEDAEQQVEGEPDDAEDLADDDAAAHEAAAPKTFGLVRVRRPADEAAAARRRVRHFRRLAVVAAVG